MRRVPTTELKQISVRSTQSGTKSELQRSRRTCLLFERRQMTTIPGHPPLIIGLGCSTAASADEIVALITACLAETARDSGSIAALATHMRKRGSTALAQAAEHYDVPLR